MSDTILGLHFGHDATLVLMQDGKIVEAMSEERLSRQKKHVGFPHLSLEYIKQKYSIETFKDVFVVGELFGEQAFHTKEDNIRFRKEEKGDWFIRAIGTKYSLLGKYFRWRDIFTSGVGRVNWEEKTKRYLAELLPGSSFTYIHHHYAHAWAAVPFMESRKKTLIFTLDGHGDDLSGSINLFEDGNISVLHKFSRRNSLGAVYASVVDILGMTKNEHEFKVMGLAPYAKKSAGEKVYEELRKLIWFDEKAMDIQSIIDTRLSTPYFISKNFNQHRFDSVAYGVQKLTEEMVQDIIRAAIKKYECGDIALGGGVFMNVKANQYILDMPEVTSCTITPSCGDESLAIGAAIYGYAKLHAQDLSNLAPLTNLYLGSEYSDVEIKQEIDSFSFSNKCSVSYVDPAGPVRIENKVAELLASNSVVGRFSGRAEWGARALGNRSILANPSSRDNVKLINEMIKGRDFWMPFATSMKYERRHDYLVSERDAYAPFMAVTFPTKELAHKELIAALHPYDLTSRPQMVKQEINPSYHALISEYEQLTKAGGILNTSFNLHGEPNVETPYDALRTFDLSGLPHLAIGNYLISKDHE